LPGGCHDFAEKVSKFNVAFGYHLLLMICAWSYCTIQIYTVVLYNQNIIYKCWYFGGMVEVAGVSWFGKYLPCFGIHDGRKGNQPRILSGPLAPARAGAHLKEEGSSQVCFIIQPYSAMIEDSP
jgi:hypothetical protein